MIGKLVLVSWIYHGYIMDISATGWVNPTYHWLTLIIESEINQARDIAHTNVRLENGKSCHVIQKHAGLPTARDRQVVLDSVIHVRIANKNWTSAKKTRVGSQ